jgi:hypothetical protein
MATAAKETPVPDDSSDHHAVVSTFDLFSIGVGPSSSHTVGPMRAAKIFISDLKEANMLDRVDSLRIGRKNRLKKTPLISRGCPFVLIINFFFAVCDF